MAGDPSSSTFAYGLSSFCSVKDPTTSPSFSSSLSSSLLRSDANDDSDAVVPRRSRPPIGGSLFSGARLEVRAGGGGGGLLGIFAPAGLSEFWGTSGSCLEGLFVDIEYRDSSGIELSVVSLALLSGGPTDE